MKKRKYFIGLLLIISYSVFGQDEKIMAAYIYQFTRYIEWCPAYKTNSFIIGVLGDSPIYEELITASQIMNVGTQNVEIKKYSSISEINTANIIVIPQKKSNQLAPVLSKIGNNCSLVIAEKSGLFRYGAAISFIKVEGKLLFELNKTSFSKHSLNVSTQLVKLAKTVI